jgi:2-succinyl-6-hydroxy-2,4-cyclohexadiene-1-carboxylate synthase
LHGFLGSALDWRKLEASLGDGYRCIFPDLPGHGQNLAGLTDRPLSLPGWANGLARTLDRLGVSAAHLVGYSLGGRLALHFARQYPERVSSLVLESASPGLAGRVERRLRRQEDDHRAEQIRQVGMEKFLEDWYRMPLFAALQRQPALLAALQRSRAGNDRQAMARVVAELSPGRQPSLWGKLSQVRMPVLLLAGELDVKYTALVGRMALELPGAEVAVALGVGHNVHLEAPEWYARQIRQFLQAH